MAIGPPSHAGRRRIARQRSSEGRPPRDAVPPRDVKSGVAERLNWCPGELVIGVRKPKGGEK
jgi:hypothetical protein